MDPIEYDPSADPLYRDVPLRHRSTIPVLGFPVHFASNAPAVIGLVEEAFGGWRILEDRPEFIEAQDVSVKIVVHPGGDGEAKHAEFFYRFIGDHRLLIGSPGSIAFSDPKARAAVGFVTPELVSDRHHFRYALLEALTLGVVTRHDRQPIHAAALERNGAAVVIAGPSGTGKSTLAYAAARAGINVMAEDTVYLQSLPFLRIWGLPGFLHLPLDGRERFPELSEAVPTILANGKEKLAIDLRSPNTSPPVVERAALCLLTRGERTRLTSVEPEAAAFELMHTMELGFDSFLDTIQEPIDRLVAQGAWRLELSEDPLEAVPVLNRLLSVL